MTVPVFEHAADLRRERLGGTRRAVVMTMGALHAGHVALMTAARALVGIDGEVVVTIFVNPTQFGAGEDFDRYPRTLDDDVAASASAGVDVVFAPSVREVYGPTGGFGDATVTIDPGRLGEILEGAARPGHVRGMLTVVAKLLGMTQPDVALFGEKDYQQLVLIRHMAADLGMPVEIVGVPTVREPDGLALSSRNRYLSAEERRIALSLPSALGAAAGAAGKGEAAALAAALAVLQAQSQLTVDYVAVTDTELGPAPANGTGRILVAARVGSTRLIDNVACQLGGS